VVITLRDSLEANTTYTLDFGNAIRDNNENNILQFSDDKETTNVNLDLKTIHLAGTYAAGVDKNGVAWAWGSNSYGVFGLPSESKVPTALPLTTSEGN
jgi:alpha-tubulin suppressor-like RCC1 family protein